MQRQSPPIKRSKQLVTLSREHHEGLLFAWKIRQGIAFGISPERIGNYCEWYRNNHLSKHFKKEELALSRALPASDALMTDMMEDHEVISLQIEQSIDRPSYLSLKFLAQIIDYHIRFEERTLFPHIENVATAEGLEQTASLLQGSTKATAVWYDEFWLNSASHATTIPQ